MIFVTGDTHGLINFDKLKKFAGQWKKLKKSDYVIIAGDFGGVWSTKNLDDTLSKYCELPFTVLFVDGNHENYDLLNKYPVQQWNSGEVQFIKEDIIHLMRGQVFSIDGNNIFTFGGATSIDKTFRKEGVSWWKEEVPTFKDLDTAITNLAKYNNQVDYIITHTCDEKSLYSWELQKTGKVSRVFPENNMLSYFNDFVKYKHWYFGHFHIDAEISDNKTALFEKIIPISSHK